MAFVSYNDPRVKSYLGSRNNTDTPLAQARPGLVMLNGRGYLVEKGLRDATFDYEGAYMGGGTDDWMWQDQNTGQQHFLSDYADKGARLYDTSEQNTEALREREGRGVFNRGGNRDGAWIAGIGNYFDTAEQADDSDSLAYLARINPTVRKQIFDAAGVATPSSLASLSKDDIATLERTMYKIDPMNFGGGYSDSDYNAGAAWGQVSAGGVDPYFAKRMGGRESFSHPENLKFDPNYGLYNDGTAGFIDRKREKGLFNNSAFKNFLGVAGAMVGAFGGFPSINITGNTVVDSAITSAGKHALTQGLTGGDITGNGLVASALSGGVGTGVGGTVADATGSKLAGSVAGGLASTATKSALSGAGEQPQQPVAVHPQTTTGNTQQVASNSTGGFALGRTAREFWS